MNILIDANILIPLEPGAHTDLEINTKAAILLHKLANESNSTLCIHPAIHYDIERDKNRDRRSVRFELIKKYKILRSPPDALILDNSIVGCPQMGSNEWVDNCLLSATFANAVDFLVSEDKGIHRKANALGLEDRVLSLQDSISLLQALFDVPPAQLPNVNRVFVYEINDNDKIFHSLRTDYEEFNKWLNRCKREHREAFIITDRLKKDLAGILIFKLEEGLPFGKFGKTLKICTFKVSPDYSGNRYGELLMKAAFDYADINRYEYIYFTAFLKHSGLMTFARSLGFEQAQKCNERGEGIFCKRLKYNSKEHNHLTALEAHIKFGPRKVFFHNNATFVVPIKPAYHDMLFPELSPQTPLFDEQRPCGNSIKKAYLCHSLSTQLSPGDNLLFYRSQDTSAVTAIGVVEDTLRSTNAGEIARYVGTRTVYTFEDIEKLCTKPTLAIKFRFAKGIPPIRLNEMQKNGILKGVPQSIRRLPSEGISWIREKISR
ncbi:GCN5-related N-acetyltransferase [Desulfatibacillum aliphaticivorans]|uniref:GCN5-related N-acetyltransferase n=1 Tax=Desulfatibacillum aliphaticivorans TaxID=218208 RepID=B8FCL7_DESAL|nr:GNAT family N-acetyltransferase [Desulfatibacillum aliphaticivorans]ACL06180.1 GCN5-related N-acetyltransferase [Desulfatibacillum aliphaticivorans]